MIAAWMFTVIVFTLLLGVAALAAERGLRMVRRPGRAPWMVALAVACGWPLVAPTLAGLLPAPVLDPMPPATPAELPPLLTVVKVLVPAPIDWIARLDTPLIVLWIAASAFLLVRLARACRTIALVERSSTPAEIAGVPVLVTSSLGPAVFGMRRPRVFVPRWLNELDASLREIVVRHEAEHCRAKDPQVALAVAVVIALMPWNLGAWWIARRVRLAIELDCDARVLHASVNRERYARLLLFIAQRQSAPAMATMLTGSTSDLSRRIAEMQASQPPRARRRAALLSLAACLALACSTRYGSELSTTPMAAPARATSRPGPLAPYYAPVGSTPATPQRWGTPPRYPDSLRLAGVEGDVVLQFIVDTSGGVMPGSIKVVSATHAQFAAAVQSVLPGAAFAAPTFEGRKVRQLVQQSWFFDMADGTAKRARAAAPIAHPSTDPGVRSPMLLGPVVTTASR